MPIVYGRDLLTENLRQATGKDKKGIQGELQILQQLEQLLPIEATIIAKPAIGVLEPDFIVIVPNEAFFIVEVKNFTLQSIQHVQSNGVIVFKNKTTVNPFSQVTAHVEQLQQFIQSNYQIDVFRCIGKAIVFPAFTEAEFMNAFRIQMQHWSLKEQQSFRKYHLFQDTLPALQHARKFSQVQLKIPRIHLLNMAIAMQPRSTSEPTVHFHHQQAICDPLFFKDVLTRIERRDAQKALPIQTSLRRLFQDNLPHITQAKTYEQVYLALSHMKVAVQAESSTYLNYLNELNRIENKMLHERTRIIEQFKTTLQQGLHMYFEQQLTQMKEAVEQNIKWHSSLADTSKKAAAWVYNPLVKMAKKSSIPQEKLENIDELDDRSIVEKTLAHYLHPTAIEKTYNLLIKQALDDYEKQWEHIIARYTPNLDGLQTLSMSTITMNNNQLKHRLGMSERALGLTVGSAVVGTIGLAAGWHTLTYAALNVFPPIAVFAVIATIATAVVGKGHEIKKQHEQLTEAVKAYEEHLFQQIDPPRLEKMQQSVFLKIEKTSDIIVQQAIAEWERQLFGKLTIKDYEQVINELVTYASFVDEAIRDVQEQLFVATL